MIARIIEWSIKNRFLVLLALFMLLAGGLFVIKNTAVDAIPDLSDVQVIVQTPYPGQAPQVVEDQVTYPLATAMLAVPGAVTVRAYSFFGDSYVYVIFKDGTDPYWARSRVLEYINQATDQLPSGVRPVLGPDATGVGWVYNYVLTDTSGKHDLSQLTSLQNWFLKFELQTVPGVAEVATVGGMVKQYQITLDPVKLRTYNLPIRRVQQAIVAANQEVGGSVLEMGEAEYMVRARGYINSVTSIQNIPVGVNHGTPILLKNIAEVGIGPQMRRGIADLNGNGEVVGGVVVMRAGGNALKTIQGVKKRIKSLVKGLPDGVNIVETYDRSGLIKRAIETLNHKLIEEFIVVMIVCIVFLFHFRSSLVVLISLPAGILGAFCIMYYQGINANIMSLGGIAIAIGAMVDATIVMIENVHKHMERETVTDDNRWQIIGAAAKEVGPALFFSLLIITLSFMPVFALQAQEGRLFTPLAFTKSYAMAVSAGLSITLVPVLMGYFIRGKILPENKNPINRFLIFTYKPFIRAVLHLPKTAILACLAVVLLTLWPWQHLGSEFMPQMDEGDWMYMPTTLPGISIGKAQQLLQQTDRLIKTVPEVKRVFGKVGRANTATDPAPLTMIETVIQFKPKSEWRSGMTPKKLKAELDALIKFPGLTNAWVMPIKTRIDMLATGIKTPIGIKVSGPSLKAIEAIGEKIEGILNTVPNTLSVYADRAAGGRYIDVAINRVAAARFGLNIKDVQAVIKHAVGGAKITTAIEGRERYPVNMRFPQPYRDSIEKIKNLSVVTPTGAHIPLDEVARIRVVSGPPMIKSENARLTGWVLVDIKGDVGSYIEQAKSAIKKQLVLPAGYALTWSGQYEYMQRASQRLAMVVPVTLIIIFILLYLNFRRFAEVFIIMGTLPLALVGGIWLLYLLDYHLSVAVGVGFIALSGVAVEIGILMLVYLNQALAEEKAVADKEGRALTKVDISSAIIKGALMRVRPIIMTVAAIIAGLLPIMLGDGTGAEVMRRIAAPMVGGMVSATILTLLLIPAVFLVWQSRAVERQYGY